MNQLDVVKKISNIKLDNCLLGIVGKNWHHKKKIVWGAGVSGKSFIEMYSHLNFSYIVDTREILLNTSFKDIAIVSPDELYAENREECVVFLPTVICQELSDDLISRGFRNVIIPNQLNKSGVGLLIQAKKINDFFTWLNLNNINYALLRWHQDGLLNIKDVDIMIDSEHIQKLLDCELLMENNGTSELIYLDVKWSKPIGLNIELPYFPIKLTKQILNPENIEYFEGIKIIKNELVIYSYVYHILFQKVEKSGLSLVNEVEDFNNKYFKILDQLRKELKIDFKISLQGLWDFVMNSSMKPPIDFVRKWAEETNSEFLKQKTAVQIPKNIEQIATFVFRNWFADNESSLEKAIEIIKSHGFILVKLHYLSQQEVLTASEDIRGGVWFETFDSRIGGLPYCFGVFKHNNLNTRPAKEAIRKYISEKMNQSINAVHASDDQLEALEYLSILSAANN